MTLCLIQSTCQEGVLFVFNKEVCMKTFFLIILFCFSFVSLAQEKGSPVISSSQSKTSADVANSTKEETPDKKTFSPPFSLSERKYVYSGVVGTVFGFGLSHGIQGRNWRAAGFMAAESLSMTLILVGTDKKKRYIMAGNEGSYYLQRKHDTDNNFMFNLAREFMGGSMLFKTKHETYNKFQVVRHCLTIKCYRNMYAILNYVI